ncbi:hypothetical protein ACFL1X_00395 [Candidatus Hydrogenedentota bacterium]
MCITRGITEKSHDTKILKADSLTDPWRLVEYLKNFGPAAYFFNFPSKFISDDGLTAWLCYSANFNDKQRPGHPPGSYYSMSLHEVRLLQ